MIFKQMFSTSSLLCEQNKDKFSISANQDRKVITKAGTVASTENTVGSFAYFYGSAETSAEIVNHFNNNEDWVIMAFLFSGDVALISLKEEEGTSLIDNKHTISYYPKDKYAINANANKALRIFEVAMKPSYLKNHLPDLPVFKQFIEKVENRKVSSVTAENGTITVQMQQIINDIIQTKKEGVFKQLFTESKLLELLLLQIEYFSDNGEMLLQTVHQSHTEKIIKAKKIIEENTYTACTLIDLAHMVGTNECTLKKGFKELTGSTVFGYWNDLKMKNAYDMIASSNIPIYEVAYQLGYKYPHHFTAAFKKKFSLTPAELRSSSAEKSIS